MYEGIYKVLFGRQQQGKLLNTSVCAFLSGTITGMGENTTYDDTHSCIEDFLSTAVLGESLKTDVALAYILGYSGVSSLANGVRIDYTATVDDETGRVRFTVNSNSTSTPPHLDMGNVVATTVDHDRAHILALTIMKWVDPSYVEDEELYTLALDNSLEYYRGNKEK